MTFYFYKEIYKPTWRNMKIAQTALDMCVLAINPYSTKIHNRSNQQIERHTML